MYMQQGKDINMEVGNGHISKVFTFFPFAFPVNRFGGSPSLGLTFERSQGCRLEPLLKIESP